jgi:hypothetical protein
MANLAPSAVTVKSNFELGDRYQKSMQESVLDLTLVLAAQGDGTSGNDIPASALGLSVIYECSSAVKADNSIILVAAPKADGSGILLKNAGSNAPAQFTGTFSIRVRGRVAS